MPQALRGSLEPCITVPVLRLKSLRQSEHRKGWGLRVLRAWMSRLPQSGQDTPLGQRCSMNHCSVKSGSPNISTASIRERPRR